MAERQTSRPTRNVDLTLIFVENPIRLWTKEMTSSSEKDTTRKRNGSRHLAALFWFDMSIITF